MLDIYLRECLYLVPLSYGAPGRSDNNSHPIALPLTIQCCQARGNLSTPVNSCEVCKAQKAPPDIRNSDLTFQVR